MAWNGQCGEERTRTVCLISKEDWWRREASFSKEFHQRKLSICSEMTPHFPGMLAASNQVNKPLFQFLTQGLPSRPNYETLFPLIFPPRVHWKTCFGGKICVREAIFYLFHGSKNCFPIETLNVSLATNCIHEYTINNLI